MLAGCGESGSSRVAVYPTQGTIYFEGQPIEGALLVLHPTGAANPEIPQSHGHVHKDGTFQLTTYQTADGVPAGDYVLTAQWQRLIKKDVVSLRGPNVLPAIFSQPATSPLKVHVIAGDNQLTAINLTRQTASGSTKGIRK